MTKVARLPTDVNYRTVTTPGNPIALTVTSTSQLVVPENFARSGLIITNISDNNVSLSFDQDAIMGGGLTLLPQMGWRMMDFDFTVAAVHAIASVDSQISIQEFNI